MIVESFKMTVETEEFGRSRTATAFTTVKMSGQVDIRYGTSKSWKSFSANALRVGRVANSCCINTCVSSGGCG